MSAPPLAVDVVDAEDDSKEFSFSLSSISPRNWRTICTAPSPRSEAEAATSSLTREQPVYRGTALLSSAEDDDELNVGHSDWGRHSQQARFGHKELTLQQLDGEEEAKVTETLKSLELPDVRVVDTHSNSLVPLPLPAVFDETYSFVSSSSASSLLAAVSSTVRAFQSNVSFSAHPVSPRLSGVFYHDNKPVFFRVSVFTSEDGESRVVEVQRRSGDMAAFHELYRFIIDCMRREGHFAAESSEMDRMEPPSMGADDDSALERSIMDMWRIKASSDRYSDARDGLHGLLSPTASMRHESLFSASELLPVIQHGIDSDYDVEQQRLAVQLLDTQLELHAPSSAPLSPALLLPLVPSLLSTARSVPIDYHTHSMRTGLSQVLDTLRSRDSMLADAMDTDSEVLDFLRANTHSTSAVGAC